MMHADPIATKTGLAIGDAICFCWASDEPEKAVVPIKSRELHASGPVGRYAIVIVTR